MELILISASKLKVMLSPEDMRRYDISCDTIDKDSAVSRRAFWNILDEAKQQTGFDPAGSKIFVQMYPSRSGGCELFVTRLSGEKNSSMPGRTESAVLAESVMSPPAKRNPLLGNEEQSIYVFTSLSDLLSGCRRLSEQKSPPAARAYADEERTHYYLVLSADTPVLSEYNGERCRPRKFAYIEEHCRLFCKDAVNLLAPFA